MVLPLDRNPADLVCDWAVHGTARVMVLELVNQMRHLDEGLPVAGLIW